MLAIMPRRSTTPDFNRCNSRRPADNLVKPPSALMNLLGGQNIRIESKRNELRELLLVEEDRLQVLVDKTKDKKILEKLKERRLAQHKKDQKKKE